VQDAVADHPVILSVMTMTSAADTGSGAGGRRLERRDLTTRALRDAVAVWFSLNPAKLATLDSATVERMAMRLEGRRLSRGSGAGDRRPPDCGHPWAG
jgi:hypothetical protein